MNQVVSLLPATLFSSPVHQSELFTVTFRVSHGLCSPFSLSLPYTTLSLNHHPPAIRFLEFLPLVDVLPWTLQMINIFPSVSSLTLTFWEAPLPYTKLIFKGGLFFLVYPVHHSLAQPFILTWLTNYKLSVRLVYVSTPTRTKVLNWGKKPPSCSLINCWCLWQRLMHIVMSKCVECMRK